MHKFIFLLKKPKVVVVAGRGKGTAREAIYQVLSRHFKIGREILLCDGDIEQAPFFLKKSQLPILVATHEGEFHPEKEFFAGDIKDADRALELAGALPSHGRIILNFDDETVREMKDKSIAHPLTFGFGAKADVRASDIVLTEAPAPGTNFKINYDGNIVPVWLEKLFGKENIYAALAAASVGEILGLNLVEVSEGLKSYFGIAGKLRLIEGIKKTWILDDSATASPLSMLEALGILGEIKITGRKIAVLGDILGVGKYSIEAHETVGEKVKKAADLLFTVGGRSKFIAEGAVKQDFPQEKTFHFETAKEAGLALQKEIQEGDLILVDGSKQMNMIEVVNEVTAQ